MRNVITTHALNYFNSVLSCPNEENTDLERESILFQPYSHFVSTYDQ